MFTNGKELVDMLDEIYESEINFSIVTSDEFGFKVEVGNEFDGFIDSDSFGSFTEALEWITDKALELYPESDYARRYKYAEVGLDFDIDEGDNDNGC